MNTLGSRDLDLLGLCKRSVRGFLRHDMPTYAAALAYRALFALLPFFAFLVALLGFFGSGLFDWLIDRGHAVLREQYAELMEQLIRQSLYQAQGGLLSSVVVIALWSVSAGVRSLTKALNAVYEVKESRPTWKRIMLQVSFALGLPIMIILALALLLIGPRVVEWFAGLVRLEEVFVYLWAWLRLPVSLVLLMLAVSAVYWALPNTNHPFRLITPGAALSVIVWVLASLAFTFYLANFANYSVVYGSLGVAIALLVYFYISAAVLLLGAEVNAALYLRASNRKPRGSR
jgi:membrane protein